MFGECWGMLGMILKLSSGKLVVTGFCGKYFYIMLEPDEKERTALEVSCLVPLCASKSPGHRRSFTARMTSF